MRRMPRVLSIQFTKASDPLQRNWASSSYSKTLQFIACACCRIYSTDPISFGRTTWTSSIRKTHTLAARSSSSICSRFERFAAAVNRLLLVLRMR